MKKLNIKDLRILQELDKNSRQPITTIARKVGLSNEVTAYRISRMEKLGILNSYYPVIDYSLLGYADYKVLFKLREVDEKQVATIIQYLSNKMNVAFVSSIGGKWDLNVDILAKSVAEFDFILQDILDTFTTQLSNYDIILKIETHLFLKDYLYPQNSKRPTYFYGAPSKSMKQKEIDTVEKKIIQLLSKNAKLSIIDIAKELHVAPNTVKNKIRKLEKENIIICHRPLIDVSKLDILSYILLIRFEELNTQTEQKLIEYAKQNQNVYYLIKLLGQFHYHLEIETIQRKRLQKIITELRTLFKNNIRETEIIVVFQDHKLDFFPVN